MGNPLSMATKERIRELRRGGMSWTELARETGVARSTCQGVMRSAVEPAPPAEVPPLEVREARILKPCPNPRIVMIYFGERRDPEIAKLVVRLGFNYTPNAPVRVVRVEGNDDDLYRLAG